MNINYYKKIDPYSLSGENKIKFFEKEINLLTVYHYNNSREYRKILNFLGYDLKKKKLSGIPFLPAKLFKKFDLLSITKKKIFKTLVSSGTTGSTPSKIYLDKENAYNQVLVLSKIMTNLLGKNRLPMLIIDQNPKLKNKTFFNARSAAIYGFSIFGSNHTYLLNEEGKIDYLLLNDFLKKFASKKFFIFGFTSFIYENLIKNLSTKSINSNFENGILLHGGGWKKMEKIKITNDIFKKKLIDNIKLKNIYNYYGLVEQTGSIFVECKKCSCFVTSIYSDVLIRDKDFNIAKNGQKGFIQLFFTFTY